MPRARLRLVGKGGAVPGPRTATLHAEYQRGGLNVAELDTEGHRTAGDRAGEGECVLSVREVHRAAIERVGTVYRHGTMEETCATGNGGSVHRQGARPAVIRRERDRPAEELILF